MAFQIFVVDDHPMMRRGYASLIAGEPDLQLVGQAQNAAEALQVVPECRPDLLITDIFLGGMSGIELVRQLKSLMPRLNVLVASMHQETLYAERALEVGAMGYIMKTASDEQILDAIRRIQHGRYYLSATMEARLLHRLVTPPAKENTLSFLASLTNRQIEVFELIGHGLTTTEIAERLYLSPKTIESHVSDIKKKLGRSASGTVQYHAVKWVEGV